MKSDDFQKLNRINASIPRHLMKKLIRVKPAFPGEREKMERVLQDSATPEHIKKMVRKSLQDGVYEKTISEVDPKVAKQIEEYVEGNIKHQVKKGKLKSKMDPWAQKRSK